MYLISLVSSTIFILCLFISIDRIRSITWINDSSEHCDFSGNDLTSIRSRLDDCPILCASTPGCTHYSWTAENRICWLKSGMVKKSDAVEKPNVDIRCGLLIIDDIDNKESSCSAGSKDKFCQEDTNSVIDLEKFQCAFSRLDAAIVERYYEKYKLAIWKPTTAEEAVVHLTFIYVITGSLRKLDVYCQQTAIWPGNQEWNYDSINRNRIFYGKEWFRMAWPCKDEKSNDYFDQNHQSENKLPKPNAVINNNSRAEISRRSSSINLDNHGERALRDSWQSDHDSIREFIDQRKRISQCFNL